MQIIDLLEYRCSRFHHILDEGGTRVSVVVKALYYKPEGRGFDTRWGEILNLPNPSGRTKPWGLHIL
jgi:hypothetical protein